MRDLVDKLVMALEKDCEIYDEILRLGEEKKQIIINGDIDKLEKMTKREHALIASLMKLEEIRDKIITQLMKETGLTSVNVLDDIIRIVDLESREKLESTKRRLGNLMKDVKDVNEANGSLIQQSLDMIEFNVNLITSIGDRETNYSGKAGINYDKNKRGAFDAKV